MMNFIANSSGFLAYSPFPSRFGHIIIIVYFGSVLFSLSFAMLHVFGCSTFFCVTTTTNQKMNLKCKVFYFRLDWSRFKKNGPRYKINNTNSEIFCKVFDSTPILRWIFKTQLNKFSNLIIIFAVLLRSEIFMRYNFKTKLLPVDNLLGTVCI